MSMMQSRVLAVTIATRWDRKELLLRAVRTRRTILPAARPSRGIERYTGAPAAQRREAESHRRMQRQRRPTIGRRGACGRAGRKGAGVGGNGEAVDEDEREQQHR